jgi:hypothetical protein
MSGDRRLLYLAWLLRVQSGEVRRSRCSWPIHSVHTYIDSVLRHPDVT